MKPKLVPRQALTVVSLVLWVSLINSSSAPFCFFVGRMSSIGATSETSPPMWLQAMVAAGWLMSSVFLLIAALRLRNTVMGIGAINTVMSGAVWFAWTMAKALWLCVVLVVVWQVSLFLLYLGVSKNMENFRRWGSRKRANGSAGNKGVRSINWRRSGSKEKFDHHGQK